MKAYIYFIYTREPAACRETTLETVEQDIRYWLGKSPGIHEIEDIIVLPESDKKDWMKVREAMLEEEAAYEAKQLEQEERATFERLKAKFQ